MKGGNPEPILTVKRIELGELIDDFGLSIEAEQYRMGKKNVVFLSILVLYKYLHL